LLNLTNFTDKNSLKIVLKQHIVIWPQIFWLFKSSESGEKQTATWQRKQHSSLTFMITAKVF